MKQKREISNGVKKAQNLLPAKKDLKTFLSEEEGKIVAKNAIKLGMVLVAVAVSLSGVMKPDGAQAGSAHSSHGSHGSHGNGGGCSAGSW